MYPPQNQDIPGALCKGTFWVDDFAFPFEVEYDLYYPKNPWTLQWRGLNLYSRGPNPQNSHFWGVRILRVYSFLESTSFFCFAWIAPLAFFTQNAAFFNPSKRPIQQTTSNNQKQKQAAKANIDQQTRLGGFGVFFGIKLPPKSTNKTNDPSGGAEPIRYFSSCR